MATSKIISYDLCSSGKNYDDLYEYIKNFPKWAHITESTWFISSELSCVDIRDAITKITDSDDRIFVAELTGVAAWRNLLCKSDYLKEHL
jgi:hypothetical protein